MNKFESRSSVPVNDMMNNFEVTLFLFDIYLCSHSSMKLIDRATNLLPL